jgi:hypothetical protein
VRGGEIIQALLALAGWAFVCTLIGAAAIAATLWLTDKGKETAVRETQAGSGVTDSGQTSHSEAIARSHGEAI